MENYSEEEAYLRARKRLEDIKGFYWHLASYVIVNLFLIILIGSAKIKEGQSLWDFGLFATPLFWGIGLLFHGLGIFGQNLFFGKQWEEQQIKKYLKDENELKNKFN